MAEMYCPACEATYPEGVDNCEEDGERLVILNEDPSLVGSVLEDKYSITDKLGEGGMGSVYLAHQQTMGRDVAVKVLRRQFSKNKTAIRRFLREAKAASKLTHPNTITVYDFGQTSEGLLYMVMERLQGKPLDELLEDEDSLPVDRAVHIITQVCDSLAEAHSNLIFHRDLKPENVFVEPKFGNPDHVKVLDFGIAKMMDEGEGNATATGMICGTPSYMSPEQAMGKQIDGRSDIYSIGIMLHEIMTGDLPFGGDTPMEVMLKHLNEPAPDLPEEIAAYTPPALQDLMKRMMAKMPEDRPSSCQVLKAELLSAIGAADASQLKQTMDGAGPVRTRHRTKDALTGFDRGALQVPVAEESRGFKKIALVAALVLAVGGAAFFATQTLLGGPGDADAEADEVASAADDANAAKAPAEVPVEAAEAAPVKEVAEATATVAAAAAEPVKEAPAAAETPEPAAAKEAPEPVAEAPEVPAEPVIETITVTIESEPAGAKLYELVAADGETEERLIGMTPISFEREKDSGSVEMVLKSKGYRDSEVAVGTGANSNQQVALKRHRGTTRRSSSPTGKSRQKSSTKHGFGTF